MHLDEKNTTPIATSNSKFTRILEEEDFAGGAAYFEELSVED